MNGPIDFKYYKAASNISFREPDGTENASPSQIWQPEQIRLFLKQNMSEFRKNVFTVATDFLQAVKQSQSALRIAFHKEPDYMFSNIKYNTGVIIRHDMVTFYKIENQQRTMSAVCFFEDTLIAGYKDIALHEDSAYTGKYQAYVPEVLTMDKEGDATIRESRTHIDATGIIVMFRTYADHDIKIVSGKSSVKLNGITYNNLNKQDIQVIDSSWYTSLVRTEGFMVRGHLRMQACGKALSERRLIYIDSFEKHGYVRKAKMLPTQTPSLSEILNQTV